jgi:hypothetical protein
LIIKRQVESASVTLKKWNDLTMETKTGEIIQIFSLCFYVLNTQGHRNGSKISRLKKFKKWFSTILNSREKEEKQ